MPRRPLDSYSDRIATIPNTPERAPWWRLRHDADGASATRRSPARSAADLTATEQERLIKWPERYRVVYQTLAAAPPVTMTLSEITDAAEL